MSRQPRIFAHRGAKSLPPENTLPAFQAALAMGVTKPWSEDPPPAELRLSADHRRLAGQALRAAGIVGSYVALCPLATGLVAGRPKQWPGFAALTAQLHRMGTRLVAVAPRDRADDLRAAVPQAAHLFDVPTGVFAAVLAGFLN